jgi:hypothetical protein
MTSNGGIVLTYLPCPAWRCGVTVANYAPFAYRSPRLLFRAPFPTRHGT